MRHRSFFLGFGTLLLLVGGAGALGAVLWWHEPDFYRRMAVPPGPQREQQSKEFQSRFFSLISGISSDRPFQEQFTQEQINSFFDEDFIRSRMDQEVLPRRMSNPRIAFEAEKARMAFRYGTEPWTTIVSIDLKAWLTQEPNVVALEIDELRAGSLPIGAQSLLESVAEAARPRDIEITWFRHKGKPVALVRFQASRARPTVQLERIELRQGMLVIGGRSFERYPLRAMLDPTGLKPTAN